MIEKVKIDCDFFSVPFLCKTDGNINYNQEKRFFLRNESGEMISHEYYCMLDLGNDHYAVCGVRSDVTIYSGTGDDYYNIIKGEYKIKTDPVLKWGIIRIKRYKSGKVVPMAETMVIPYLYDKISENNSKTATVYYKGDLSYIDLDINRKTYGNQLVLRILDSACPFDVPYEGFAECSIRYVGDRVVVGYLPRNCKSMQYFDGSKLLTRNQVLKIIKYLSGKSDLVLDEETISKYYYLTGEILVSENVKKLKKI